MITNFKITTSVNNAIVEPVEFPDYKGIVNATSIDTVTGEILSGNIQVQKKGKTPEGMDTAEYAGQYSIEGSRTNFNNDGKITDSELIAVVDAIKAEIKAEILK